MLTWDLIEFGFKNKFNASPDGISGVFLGTHFLILSQLDKKIRIDFFVSGSNFSKETFVQISEKHQLRLDKIKFFKDRIAICLEHNQLNLLPFIHDVSAFFSRSSKIEKLAVNLESVTISREKFEEFKLMRKSKLIKICFLVISILALYLLSLMKEHYLFDQMAPLANKALTYSYIVGVACCIAFYFIAHKVKMLKLSLGVTNFWYSNRSLITFLLPMVIIISLISFDLFLISNSLLDNGPEEISDFVAGKPDTDSCYPLQSMTGKSLILCSSKLNLKEGEMISANVHQGYWGIQWISKIR